MFECTVKNHLNELRLSSLRLELRNQLSWSKHKLMVPESRTQTGLVKRSKKGSGSSPQNVFPYAENALPYRCLNKHCVRIIIIITE